MHMYAHIYTYACTITPCVVQCVHMYMCTYTYACTIMPCVVQVDALQAGKVTEEEVATVVNLDRLAHEESQQAGCLLMIIVIL